MLVLTWWEIWCQSHCACYPCTDVSQWFLSPCWLGGFCQLKMLERNCTWQTRHPLSGEHSHFFPALPEPGMPENHRAHWTGPSSSFQDSVACLTRRLALTFPYHLSCSDHSWFMFFGVVPQLLASVAFPHVHPARPSYTCHINIFSLNDITAFGCPPCSYLFQNT